MGALSAKPASAEELQEIRHMIVAFEKKRGEGDLGLRFENRKAPIGMVVVDRAGKAPAAN